MLEPVVLQQSFFQWITHGLYDIVYLLLGSVVNFVLGILLVLIESVLFFENPTKVSEINALWTVSLGLFGVIFVMELIGYYATWSWIPSDNMDTPFEIIQRFVVATIVLIISRPLLGWLVEFVHLISRWFYPAELSLSKAPAVIGSAAGAFALSGIVMLFFLLIFYFGLGMAVLSLVGFLALRMMLIYTIYGIFPIIMGFWVIRGQFFSKTSFLPRIAFRVFATSLLISVFIAAALGTGGAIANYPDGSPYGAEAAGMSPAPSHAPPSTDAFDYIPAENKAGAASLSAVAIRMTGVFGGAILAASIAMLPMKAIRRLNDYSGRSPKQPGSAASYQQGTGDFFARLESRRARSQALDFAAGAASSGTYIPNSISLGGRIPGMSQRNFSVPLVGGKDISFHRNIAGSVGWSSIKFGARTAQASGEMIMSAGGGAGKVPADIVQDWRPRMQDHRALANTLGKAFDREKAFGGDLQQSYINFGFGENSVSDLSDAIKKTDHDWTLGENQILDVGEAKVVLEDGMTPGGAGGQKGWLIDRNGGRMPFQVPEHVADNGDGIWQLETGDYVKLRNVQMKRRGLGVTGHNEQLIMEEGIDDGLQEGAGSVDPADGEYAYLSLDYDSTIERTNGEGMEDFFGDELSPEGNVPMNAYHKNAQQFAVIDRDGNMVDTSSRYEPQGGLDREDYFDVDPDKFGEEYKVVDRYHHLNPGEDEAIEQAAEMGEDIAKKREQWETRSETGRVVQDFGEDDINIGFNTSDSSDGPSRRIGTEGKLRREGDKYAGYYVTDDSVVEYAERNDLDVTRQRLDRVVSEPDSQEAGSAYRVSSEFDMNPSESSPQVIKATENPERQMDSGKLESESEFVAKMDTSVSSERSMTARKEIAKDKMRVEMSYNDDVETVQEARDRVLENRFGETGNTTTSAESSGGGDGFGGGDETTTESSWSSSTSQESDSGNDLFGGGGETTESSGSSPTSQESDSGNDLFGGGGETTSESAESDSSSFTSTTDTSGSDSTSTHDDPFSSDNNGDDMLTETSSDESTSDSQSDGNDADENTLGEVYGESPDENKTELFGSDSNNESGEVGSVPNDDSESTEPTDATEGAEDDSSDDEDEPYMHNGHDLSNDEVWDAFMGDEVGRPNSLPDDWEPDG